MESRQLIRDNLIRSEDIVLSRIEEMREHALVIPTPNGGCHTLWVLGHLAYIEGLGVHQFMLGGTNPLEEWAEVFDGSEVSGDAGAFPDFDTALHECRTMRSKTKVVLDGLSEESLDQAARACPEGAEALFGTYRLCLQSCADHWFMHRGQLADARRAAGLDRMWF